MEHPREGDVESPTGAPAQVIDPRRGGDRNFDLYVTCLYWAITTISTVGFGDIHPNTPGEKIYTSVVMVTGVGVYAVIISAFGAVIASSDARGGQPEG